MPDARTPFPPKKTPPTLALARPSLDPSKKNSPCALALATECKHVLLFHCSQFYVKCHHLLPRTCALNHGRRPCPRFTSDLLWVVKCLQVGPDLLCPPQDLRLEDPNHYLMYEKTCSNGGCPHAPRAPYSTSMDNLMPEEYRICGQATGDDGTQTAKYVSSSTRIVSRVVILLRVVRAFMGLNKVRRIGSLIRVTISARASRGVRRFRTMGFDLDLTYITDRTVIMAAPAHDKLYTKDAAGKSHGFNDSEQISR